ncbi:putative protein unc-13 [Helianthus annuus]|nr:putative protein unc-13 [Helianthus annuus]
MMTSVNGETAYEILLAAAGASWGLIVPSKENKQEKKSRLLKKLGRSKSEQVTTQQSTGLTGLLETMRVRMEVQCERRRARSFITVICLS